jgi:hypothetical protein
MATDTLVAGPFLGSSRNPYSYEKVEQTARDLSTAWLTLGEITQQLNLFDDESQDTYLSSLELAVRMAVEDFLGMSIFPITYKAYYGATNTTGTQMCLDLPAVSQNNQGTTGVVINSVAYYNGNTPPVLTTIPSTDYFYDPSGNKVIVSQGLPNSVNTVMTSPIVVTYQTNSSPYAQYPVIKQAGLLLLTHLYNNRSNTTEGILHEIPFGVAALLRPYKPLVM